MDPNFSNSSPEFIQKPGISVTSVTSAQDAIEARSQREFGQLLRTVFKAEQGRTGSARYWKGIRLNLDSSANDAGSTSQRTSTQRTLAELMRD